MRNGQNKRMRGRNNHRKNHNPMVRVYESNGPDVKIRGNPSQNEGGIAGYLGSAWVCSKRRCDFKNS